AEQELSLLFVLKVRPRSHVGARLVGDDGPTAIQGKERQEYRDEGGMETEHLQRYATPNRQK
ncbi:hypothetical protein PanWU01x14_259410, partial [Parasponia andersonii]